MKTKSRIVVAGLALVLALTSAATASPLPRERISADAKWLLHADLVDFRSSQLGHYVQTNILDEPLEELTSELKFDAKALLQKVTSITAYGNDFKKEPQDSMATGVLILQADADAQVIVEGALAAQMLANTNSPMKKLQTQPYPLYAVGKDLYGAIQPGGIIMLGKSRERIDQAAQVLAGKLPNLTAGKAFTDFPATPDSFIFLGVAEGFNQLAAMPPQAKVLQMADGVRIVLGEKADVLFADLALKSKSAEVVAQIQQVLQGIIALFSLGQPEDKDLAELVRNTKVTSTDKLVAVGLQFPVAKALARFAEDDKPDPKHAPKQHKSGGKKSKRHDDGEAAPKPAGTEKGESK